MAFGVID